MRPTVVVAVHDGFYGCGTGAGLCNRALLEIVVSRIGSRVRLVVAPIGLSATSSGYDPAWHNPMAALVARVRGEVWPVDNGSRGRSRFGGLAEFRHASADAGRLLARGLVPSGTADRTLIVAVDVPFFGLAHHLPPALARRLLVIAQGIAAVHAPHDGPRLDWECRALRDVAAAGGQVAATSLAMRRHLVAGYGLPDATVIDLPNGLTPTDWRPIPAEDVPALPKPAQAGFVFAMGRAEHHKGFDDLLDAVTLLRHRRVTVPHLLLAAVTDDPTPNTYQRHLADRITAENIDATLWTRFSHGIRGLLSHPAVTAVVVPSRVEPFGRIPLEAYAAGAAPVVATTAGGLAALVTDGGSGYTASPADPPGLAAALHRALQADRHTRERLRRTGREVALRYDYDRTVTDLLARIAPWLLTEHAEV
jgi:glycosyltransferase involved in cell wall biosynthesis